MEKCITQELYIDIFKIIVLFVCSVAFASIRYFFILIADLSKVGQ